MRWGIRWQPPGSPETSINSTSSPTTRNFSISADLILILKRCSISTVSVTWDMESQAGISSAVVSGRRAIVGSANTSRNNPVSVSRMLS